MPGVQDRPRRALAALTALVLLAHLALLSRAPHWHSPRPVEPARSWSMRALPPDSAPAPAAPMRGAAMPQALANAAPRPHTPTRQAAVRVHPAAAEAGSASPSAPAMPPPAAVHAPLALPGPARWHYDVQIQVRQQRRQAQGTLLWQHDGSRYEARLELSEGFAPGPRSLSSTGRIGPDGLAPTRFADTGRRANAAHIDAGAARVVFSANTPDAALQAGAQDRLSVMLHLAGLLEGAPTRYGPGSIISLQTIGAREAELWTFTVEGPDTVALADGPASLLKLVREPQRGYEARIEVWFDPRRGHLPARIRTTLVNGDWLDQRLHTAENIENR